MGRCLRGFKVPRRILTSCPPWCRPRSRVQATPPSSHSHPVDCPATARPGLSASAPRAQCSSAARCAAPISTIHPIFITASTYLRQRIQRPPPPPLTPILRLPLSAGRIHARRVPQLELRAACRASSAYIATATQHHANATYPRPSPTFPYLSAPVPAPHLSPQTPSRVRRQPFAVSMRGTKGHSRCRIKHAMRFGSYAPLQNAPAREIRAMFRFVSFVKPPIARASIAHGIHARRRVQSRVIAIATAARWSKRSNGQTGQRFDGGGV